MSIQPKFCDHAVVQASPNDYIEMTRAPKDILDAWSLSMFAHELLNKDGSVKANDDMNEVTLEKYLNALDALKRNEDIDKPVIGIGIMDGVANITEEITLNRLQDAFDVPVQEVIHTLGAPRDLPKENHDRLLKTFCIIADTREEIRIARQFGMVSIAITGGYNSLKVLHDEKPDHLIEHLSEIPALFQTVKPT